MELIKLGITGNPTNYYTVESCGTLITYEIELNPKLEPFQIIGRCDNFPHLKLRKYYIDLGCKGKENHLEEVKPITGIQMNFKTVLLLPDFRIMYFEIPIDQTDFGPPETIEFANFNLAAQFTDQEKSEIKKLLLQ